MARSKKVKKRTIAVDPIYQSRVVAKLVNRIIKNGKKETAANLVYKSLMIIQEKNKKDSPLNILKTALENIKPAVEVRSRRVGGAAYQVPTPVRGDRKESLAIRWLVLTARERSNKEYHTFAEKLAAEILDAYNNQGGAIKKKLNIQRNAEANKAFAHFRW